MRAGQQGLKALAAALKRSENKFLKYKYATHSQLTWNEVQHKLYKVLEKINQTDRSLKSGYRGQINSIRR